MTFQRSFFASLCAFVVLIHANLNAQIPDFTAGGTIPAGADHDWNLGATGARGWIYSDKLVTSDARQIFVTSVASGSPAAGKLAAGDVILGVSGSLFSYDPRTEFGKALTLAEAGNGQLSVIRWRSGSQSTITINLPILGTYSATAPYNCPKSQAILAAGITKLAQNMATPGYNPRNIPRALNALALLASGDSQYHSLVRGEAQWAANYRTSSFATWYYGYNLILLAEYTIATGSQEFVPKMRELALLAADGQSNVGSWGHRFSNPDGRLAGYGMMNAPGASLTIGLTLARLAGVNDTEVTTAINQSAKLLRFYQNKGAIPYGDHDPWIESHDDNGKNGMAAVLFDILGETGPATYFSRTSVASHGPERDTGHTGNFFNLLWSVPSVARSGQNASGAWMGEFGSWYFDLARQSDGTFLHQGPPQDDHDSYENWDSTGAYLLSYAMPLKAIHLTGKQDSIAPQLNTSDSNGLIADGLGWNNKDRTGYYRSLSDNELYARLSSWSPTVRERAGKALANRYVVPQTRLIDLLAHPDLYPRIGACQALAASGGFASPAVDALRATLQADDMWLRVQAARALGKIGNDAVGTVPDLLTLMGTIDELNDPRGMEQRYISFALFDNRDGLLKNSLSGVDRTLLIEAIQIGLGNEDGRARSTIGNVFDQLNLAEITPLLPYILDAVVEPAPSGIMFADGIREEGLKTLLRHNIGDGMQAAVDYIADQNPWASEHRTPRILATLLGYGTHAADFIPQLEAIAADFDDGEPDFPLRLSQDKAAYVRAAIVDIQAFTDGPDLIWIDDLQTPPVTGPAIDPLTILTPATLSGINPATGFAWQPGDRYRLAFLTSERRDATSSNIHHYNAFVSSLAASSPLRLSGIDWRVIASTADDDARDNTSTNPNSDGTGEAIFLVDGSTLLATGYNDLWNGISINLSIDENGNTPSTYLNRIFTGSDGDGTAAGNGRTLGTSPNIRTGDSLKTGTSWMIDFNQSNSTPGRFFALSEPITLTTEVITPTPGLDYRQVLSDLDSEIDSSKTFTHAIDFGRGATANVNGVLFVNDFNTAAGGRTNSGTRTYGNSDHSGNTPPAVGGNVASVFRDMVYGGPDLGYLELDGLIPGQWYELKLFDRAWSLLGSRRTFSVIFDIDADNNPEFTTQIIDQDNPAALPRELAGDISSTINYRYQAGISGKIRLTIDLADDETGSYHLYGLTNEEIGDGTPSPSLDFDDGGLVDFLEKVFGGNRSNGDDDLIIAPKMSPTPNAEGKMEYTYRCTSLAAANPNLSMVVEYSSDLDFWFEARHTGDNPGDITATQDDNFYNPGIHRMKVAIPSSLLSGDDDSKFFMRLRVIDNSSEN